MDSRVLNATGSMTALPAWRPPCLLPSYTYSQGRTLSNLPVQPSARPRSSFAVLEGYFNLPIVFGHTSQLANLGAHGVLCQNVSKAGLVSVHLLWAAQTAPKLSVATHTYFSLFSPSLSSSLPLPPSFIHSFLPSFLPRFIHF